MEAYFNRYNNDGKISENNLKIISISKTFLDVNNNRANIFSLINHPSKINKDIPEKKKTIIKKKSKIFWWGL